MDYKELRRLNLRQIIDEEYDGNIASLARAMNKQPSQLNRLFAPSLSNRRDVGDKLARLIEQTAKKPRGWLDGDHWTQKVNDEKTKYIRRHLSAHHLVPLIEHEMAKNWADAVLHLRDTGHNLYYMPCPVEHGPDTYALLIKTDDMTSPYGESYPVGSTIFVDPGQVDNIHSGDAVVATLAGKDGIVFKSYFSNQGEKYLKPLNPQHPIIADEFVLLGKVLGQYVPAPSH